MERTALGGSQVQLKQFIEAEASCTFGWDIVKNILVSLVGGRKGAPLYILPLWILNLEICNYGTL